MNYKNCKHYNEIVRVLSENLSLEDVNFKLEETKGCECKVDEDSVCELWVTLAFAHDMAPKLGIEHAEQTIANLDTRMKEIATRLVTNIDNKPESVEETETISETNIDSQLFAALPEEKQKLIEQLLEMGDVTFIKSDSSRNELIVKAISEMDLEQLEILTENYLSKYKREEFLKYIKSKFNKFTENNDTHLIARSGSCSGYDCNIGSSGYTFIGNNSNTYCNIIFENENGICKDICKCHSFKVDDIFINKARKKELDSHNFTDEELDDLPF
jgi:hypothetical protein